MSTTFCSGSPRAHVPLPIPFASTERRLIAAGVTTEFHAISFMDRAAARRSVYVAETLRFEAHWRATKVAHLELRGNRYEPLAEWDVGE